jgi:hypothetical protein
MKLNFVILLFLVSLSAKSQVNVREIDFLKKWTKSKHQTKIILMNDYILDFALFRNYNYIIKDSNCIRSFNKKYYDYSEMNEVLFYFINLFLMNNTKPNEVNICYFSFISNMLYLASHDQQEQLFNNYINSVYLDERFNSRKVLTKSQIDRLNKMIPLFRDNRVRVYYQKKIMLLYKIEVKIDEEINKESSNCFCK